MRIAGANLTEPNPTEYYGLRPTGNIRFMRLSLSFASAYPGSQKMILLRSTVTFWRCAAM